jgi:hypothetical protein
VSAKHSQGLSWFQTDAETGPTRQKRKTSWSDAAWLRSHPVEEDSYHTVPTRIVAVALGPRNARDGDILKEMQCMQTRYWINSDSGCLLQNCLLLIRGYRRVEDKTGPALRYMAQEAFHQSELHDTRKEVAECSTIAGRFSPRRKRLAVLRCFSSFSLLMNFVADYGFMMLTAELQIYKLPCEFLRAASQETATGAPVACELLCAKMFVAYRKSFV